RDAADEVGRGLPPAQPPRARRQAGAGGDERQPRRRPSPRHAGHRPQEPRAPGAVHQGSGALARALVERTADLRAQELGVRPVRRTGYRRRRNPRGVRAEPEALRPRAGPAVCYVAVSATRWPRSLGARWLIYFLVWTFVALFLISQGVARA